MSARSVGSAAAWPLRGLTAAAILALVFVASAAAASLPALTGRVVDNAGLIDPATRSAIEAKLKAHEEKSSDQVVVATIPGLEGEVLEDYANRLFRAWGLGQAQQNNGVLLLVARDDRKIRIEVGYGLEGTLTDLHSKLIIDNTIVPAFRAGNFAGGISAGVDDILTVLTGDGAELEERARKRDDSQSWTSYIPGIFIALWISLFVSIFGFAILAPIFGRKLGPGRYRWLGIDVTVGGGGSSGRSSGSSSGWSSGGGGGFSGGGGSSGGGGASGGW
ncbi:MAG: YgcG family protein [Rhizobiaceae bacterium]